MKDGWWVNYETGVSVVIEEHEQDIRKPEIAGRLGVPDAVFTGFTDYVPVTDRIRFLTYLMQRLPLMRVRGHGTHATLEYWCEDNAKPAAAIARWTQLNAGEALMLSITNLASGANRQGYARQFSAVGGPAIRCPGVSPGPTFPSHSPGQHTDANALRPS